ncbi:MAG: DUF4244 domain-containing protein [Actinomycetes bacterium]
MSVEDGRQLEDRTNDLIGVQRSGQDLETEAAETTLVSGPRRAWLDDAGMATAEYAVATLAACGFAGLLLVLLTGGEVRGMLLAIVKRALTIE